MKEVKQNDITSYDKMFLPLQHSQETRTVKLG